MKKLLLGTTFCVALLLAGAEASNGDTLTTFAVKSAGVVLMALTAWGFHVEFKDEQ
jgi:hypothetical protein